ncbi:MAG: 2-oxo acid dehydrogenase subunit E2 [Spirochaetaceae bacterium]|jgi:pyruvate/2-oxoglutarate dehydrogenase complex dihydrolipoamide acyltransferase (E2) component|nr:2-oxo acid dehydrogenase subunit E2 [Spirochaetaceae bacterium]
MPNNITEIKIPQENVNDETVVIAEFMVDDMSSVETDTEIACLETSKATFTVTAPKSGIIHFLVEIGSEVPVGNVLAIIGKDKSDIGSYHRSESTVKIANMQTEIPVLQERTQEANSSKQNVWIEYSDVRPTMAAQRVLTEKGLIAEQLGLRGLVKLSDVLQKLEPESNKQKAAIIENILEISPKANMQLRNLSKAKRSEIQFLTSANSSALLSQVSVLVPTNGFFKKALNEPSCTKQFSSRIIFEVSRLLQKYPDLQCLYHNGQAYQYTDTNIGYAMCIEGVEGHGLKVPVFRNCDKMSLDDIVSAKDAFLEKYITNTLSLEDLDGGTFTITDLSASGSWLFNPLLNYMQSAILGIGGENPQGDAFPLVLAFDHRVTDGMTATAFLNELKERLVSHQKLLQVDEDATDINRVLISDELKPAAQSVKTTEEELPFCSRCYRDIDELIQMGQYLIQTIGRNGQTQMQCTICMEGL